MNDFNILIIDNQYGEYIKNNRELLGINANELASIIGVTPASISQWESNDKKPDIDNIVKLAQLFRVSLDEFVNCTYSIVNKDYSFKEYLSLEEKPLLDDISTSVARKIINEFIVVTKECLKMISDFVGYDLEIDRKIYDEYASLIKPKIIISDLEFNLDSFLNLIKAKSFYKFVQKDAPKKISFIKSIFFTNNKSFVKKMVYDESFNKELDEYLSLLSDEEKNYIFSKYYYVKWIDRKDISVSKLYIFMKRGCQLNYYKRSQILQEVDIDKTLLIYRRIAFALFNNQTSILTLYRNTELQGGNNDIFSE